MTNMNSIRRPSSVWILGCGTFGRDIAIACEKVGIFVHGFLQTKVLCDVVDGRPCRLLRDMEPDGSTLILGVFNPQDSYRDIFKLVPLDTFENILFPWDLYSFIGSLLGWRYWLREPDYLDNHSEDLERTFESLSDQESRDCLRRVCDFRKGIDVDYSGFQHAETQYFNSLTLGSSSPKAIKYVDGGALGGESFFELLKYSEIDVAWLFEPDPQNFELLYSNCLSIRENANCVPLALANNYSILKFSMSRGGASCIDGRGDYSIASVSIDQFLAGQTVDLIKLDIEGAELSALRGAEKTIQNHRPKLAVSCYHRPDDLWVLTDYLRTVCSSYNFYLRQHAANSFDLVLYAIPKG